jgi:hypothetical protein
MEQNLQKENPLKQYFRSIKMYMELPSGTSYYEPGSISFTDHGEVGIMPMTGKDELVLKNPDALYNGEALIEVIASCVPAIKNPRILLTNDIDALVTAIRHCTFENSLETELVCPKCKATNSYKLNLQYALDGMEKLEPEYVINLESGLSVFIKPYSYPDLMMSLHDEFERRKIGRILDSDTISDEDRSKLFTKAFKGLAVSKFQLLKGAVVKIVDESKGVNVSDKVFVKEFLENSDRTVIDKIDSMVTEINQIGIRRTFTAKCVSCEHEWESKIDFNPVNFS